MKLEELNNRLETAVNDARKAQGILKDLYSEILDLRDNVKHRRQREPLSTISEGIDSAIATLAESLSDLEEMFMEKNALLSERIAVQVSEEKPKRSFWNPFA